MKATMLFLLMPAMAGVLSGQAVIGARAQRVADAGWPFQFTAPAGFQVTKSEYWYILTMGDRDILVAQHKERDKQVLLKNAAEGFLFGEVIQLRAAGPVTTPTAATIAVDLAGTVSGKAAMGHMLVVNNPAGGGAIVLAGGPPSGAREYAQLTAAVARTIEWNPVEGGMAVSGGMVTPGGGKPGNSPWVARLANQKLHYFARYNSGGGGGGYADHKYMGLCADGSFFFKGDFSASINVPGANASAGNRGGNVGRWTVTGDTLTLVFANGGQARYTLSTDGEKTFLNNTRWLKEEAPECR